MQGVISAVSSLPIARLAGGIGFVFFLRGDCDVWTRVARIPAAFYRDKVVWVTGATSGIGRSLCELLAAREAKLIVSARNPAALATLVDELMALGARSVVSVPFDLSSGMRAVEKAAEKALSIFGGLDMLCNNAGVGTRASAAELESDGVHRVMEINFFAPIALTRACLPALTESGGIILNTSSLAATIALPLRSSYAASKAALERYFESFRYENPRVQVTSFWPGRTTTMLSHNAVAPGNKIWGRTDASSSSGLAPERVADRALAAAACGLKQSWIAIPKELMVIRIATYLPFLWSLVAVKLFSGKK